MQFIHDKTTNLYYYLSAIGGKKHNIGKAGETVSLLGKQYELTNENLKLENMQIDLAIDEIAWFCYRKGFDPIELEDEKRSLNSDSGWGCMVRAGQMMSFVFLLKYFKNDDPEFRHTLIKAFFKEFNGYNKLGKLEGDKTIDKAIKETEQVNVDEEGKKLKFEDFISNKDIKVDLTGKLAETNELKLTYERRPSLEISRVLFDEAGEDEDDIYSLSSNEEELVFEKKDKKDHRVTNLPESVQMFSERYKEKFKHDLFSLQNFVLNAKDMLNTKPGNWFKPTTFLLVAKKLIEQNFTTVSMINVVENIFFFQPIIESVFNKPPDNISEMTKEQAIDYLKYKEWDNTLILSVSTMLGLSKPDKIYKPFLDKLIESKSFCGLLGGRNNSAYYIIGKNNKETYYYLDPHYVCGAIKDYNNKKQVKKEFFDKQVFEIKYNKLNTSVSFCFYLRNEDDFADLWDIFDELETHYGDDYFMSYMINDDFKDGLLGEDDILVFN